jgi:hypothetical protein
MNLRMVVDCAAADGPGQILPGNTLLVGAFPAAITITMRIRYDGGVPPNQAIEASVETPSGTVAERHSSYTGTQNRRGEITIPLRFTAYEAGTYTARAMLGNQDVPPKKLTIRRSAAISS